MQSYRNNPDSPECEAAHRDNERAIFAAQMQAERRNKPIAYRLGNAGEIYHAECWADFSSEYLFIHGQRPFLGALYMAGDRKLRDLVCPHCKQAIEPEP